MKTGMIISLAAIVFLICGTVRADDPKSDKTRIQGEWILSQGTTNGSSLSKKLRQNGIEEFAVRISGNEMTMGRRDRAEHNFKYKFTLHPEQRPKAIDVVTVEAHGTARKGIERKAIYKIEEDKLTLCLPDKSDGKRPKKFTAPKGSRRTVLVLTRPEDAQDGEE